MRKDGTYTLDFNEFDYGHWTKKDNQLVLANSDSVAKVYTIRSETSNEIQLLIGKSGIANFESQPSSFTSIQNEPFSVINNKWRIGATARESEQQIKNRLRNHCKFWETYFTWALDNNLPVVDVRSTPTPIKIYGNGFGLKPFKDLPSTWRSYFYDSADFKQASNIIQEIFEQKTIAWPHTDSKYKMFIGAFKQMEQYLQ